MTTPPTTRERIRNEAAALFRVKGYNGTSMAELAAEVGMTKSSLYHHFPSKQALLSEIIELTVARVTPLLQAIAESDLPADEKLRRAVFLHTVEAIHDRDAVACFAEEGRFLASDHMSDHLDKRDRYEQLFRRIFDEGTESGVFAPQDVNLSVKAVLGMCNSSVRWYRPDGGHTAEEISDELARFALRAATGGRDEGSFIEEMAYGRRA